MTVDEARQEHDTLSTTIDALRSRLVESRERAEGLARRRRELLLPAELGEGAAVAEKETVEAELATVSRAVRDLTDTVAEAQARLADLKRGIREAELEDALVRLEANLLARTKAAKKVDRAVIGSIEAAAAWNELQTQTIALAVEAGFADRDVKALEKPRHLSGHLLWAFERFLPPDVSRPHRAFRRPLAETDGEQMESARRAAERVRERLQTQRQEAVEA